LTFAVGVLGVVALGVGVAGVGVLGVAVPGVGVPGVGMPGVLPETVGVGGTLTETVGAAVLVPPAAKDGGVDGEPDWQADTDAVASMPRAAQPSTVPRRRRRP
jgi:hypothetical protein